MRPTEIAEHDAVPVAKPGPRQNDRRQSGILKVDRKGPSV